MNTFFAMMLALANPQAIEPTETDVARQIMVESWICQLTIDPETGARQETCTGEQAIALLESLYAVTLRKKDAGEKITHVFCEKRMPSFKEAQTCDPAPFADRVRIELYRVRKLVAQAHRQALALLIPTSYP